MRIHCQYVRCGSVNRYPEGLTPDRSLWPIASKRLVMNRRLTALALNCVAKNLTQRRKVRKEAQRKFRGGYGASRAFPSVNLRHFASLCALRAFALNCVTKTVSRKDAKSAKKRRGNSGGGMALRAPFLPLTSDTLRRSAPSAPLR
jgi:hypothetical protein